MVKRFLFRGGFTEACTRQPNANVDAFCARTPGRLSLWPTTPDRIADRICRPKTSARGKSLCFVRLVRRVWACSVPRVVAHPAGKRESLCILPSTLILLRLGDVIPGEWDWLSA